MRRTDEAFKAEVLRRSEAYLIRRKKRRRMVAALCLPMLLCSGALMALLSGGYGGSTETADLAYSMNGAANNMDAPAAVMQEAPKEEEIFAESGIKSDSSAVVRSVEIISQPESEEYARIFTEPEKIYAIIDAIQAFYDDSDTIPGGSEIGASEGMSYRIIVTEDVQTREYTLFNNALASDGEAGWLVNPACYQALERLIMQEGD